MMKWVKKRCTSTHLKLHSQEFHNSPVSKECMHVRTHASTCMHTHEHACTHTGWVMLTKWSLFWASRVLGHEQAACHCSQISPQEPSKNFFYFIHLRVQLKILLVPCTHTNGHIQHLWFLYYIMNILITLRECASTLCRIVLVFPILSVYIIQSVCLFVCLFAVNAKTTGRIDAKCSGISENDLESVLHGLQLPVLVLLGRYHEISGFSFAANRQFYYLPSASGSCLDSF